MLRLKKRSHNKISIVIRKNARAPKRYLFRGFLFAIFFHLCLLFLFQIRVQYVEKDTKEEAPMVLLEPEESLISVLTESSGFEEDFPEKLTKELHLSQNVFMPQAESSLPLEEPEESSAPLTPPTISLLPWSFSDGLSPSRYTVKAYPLKITLGDQLKKLYFIDDGAELFQKASYDSLFTSPFFAESQPKVGFRIDISLKTGKITRIECLRELVDKRLQEIAVKLLRTFRFASAKQESSELLSGEIELQFAGTYDSIEPLLGHFLHSTHGANR